MLPVLILTTGKARLNIMPKVELIISQTTIIKMVNAIRFKKATTSGSIF
jgi:hypothetical protein